MTAMRIAYHTTDEVNLDSAMQAAQEYGVSLGPLPDPDAPPDRSFAAVLYELDHMDCQRRQAIVSELLSRPAQLPVAVHGYNLEDEEMTVLHANGVAVYRQFDPEVVRALCRASEFSRRSAPDPVNRDSQGASGDPAVLCGMERSLATHTYRALHCNSDGTPDGLPHQMGELRQRVDQLQQQIDRLRRQQDIRLEDLQL